MRGREVIAKAFSRVHVNGFRGRSLCEEAPRGRMDATVSRVDIHDKLHPPLSPLVMGGG